MFQVKIPCYRRKCRDLLESTGVKCPLCEGRGYLRLGLIEWALWQLAKYMKILLERYGD